MISLLVRNYQLGGEGDELGHIKDTTINMLADIKKRHWPAPQTFVALRALRVGASRRAIVDSSLCVDSALLAAYAGRYQLPHHVVTVTHEDDRLYIDVPVDGRLDILGSGKTVPGTDR